MDGDIYRNALERIKSASETMYKYSQWVNDMEFFPEENGMLFTDHMQIERYKEIWFALEIINACALSEWEESEKNKEFDVIWQEKYKKEATNLLCEMEKLLQCIIGMDK